MPRIQSSSDPSGTNPYEFPYNPTEYDSQDSLYAESVDILHGAPSWQRPAWDGRPRSMIWRNVGITTTVDGIGRATMVDTMRNWVGNLRYFNFQNIDRANENWPVSDTWKKARVINLQCQVKPGGELRYDTVTLVLQPEE